MDIKTAVIYRLNDLINQKDITVNEAAVCSIMAQLSRQKSKVFIMN